jgi:hypothetical protein
MAYVEVVFDILYLLSVLVIYFIAGRSLNLFQKLDRQPLSMVSLMACVLFIGDFFHLYPRIVMNIRYNKPAPEKRLIRGTIISSFTMSVFYLIMWFTLPPLRTPVLAVSTSSTTVTIILNVIFALLFALRIFFCVYPMSQWHDKEQSKNVKWGIRRNVPFFLMGIMVIIKNLLATNDSVYQYKGLWIAVSLSFIFYIPVVLWAKKKPALASLMLPKSLAYIAMLIIMLIGASYYLITFE